MSMQVLNLVQGSPEWKAIRGKYRVASEAAAMMGADPDLSRSDLLRLKSTGVEREINEWVEKVLFKRGHETEARARPIAEKRIGDALPPVVGVNTVEGIAMLASFDGMTVPMYDLHWEHKQYNKELFAIVEAGGELPPKIYWQLEHQLAVNENDYGIFAVSDGTEKNYRQFEYHSRPDRRRALLEGWKLFDKDLAVYVPEEIKLVPAGETIQDLPALDVEVVSELKRSNLAVYRANLLDFVANINEDLQTDQDFATAKNVVKFLADREKELALIKRRIVEGSASTSEAVRSIDQLDEAMREKRLFLDKLVAAEEKNRKSEIIEAVRKEWQLYVADINKTLAPLALPAIEVDFATAVRNRRTLATYKEAARAELLRVRIVANTWKDHISKNFALLTDLAGEHMALFRDIQTLITKDPEALEAIAKARISEHEAKIKAAADRIAAENEAKRKAAEEAEAKRKAAAEAPKPVPVQPTAPAPQQTAPAPAIATTAQAAPIQGDLMSTTPAATMSATAKGPGSVVSYGGGRTDFSKAPPSDRAIIAAVAMQFNVSTAKAIDWIAGINLAEARKWANSKAAS